MIIPTIHLNGTSRGELLRQTEAAEIALRAAIEALGQMSPNARDYYPQGPRAFGQAIDAHTSRIVYIQKVLDEVIEIMNLIYEGQPEVA